jgi:hypothetical protein
MTISPIWIAGADGAALDGCMKNAALLRGVSRINIEQSFGPQIQTALIRPLVRMISKL